MLIKSNNKVGVWRINKRIEPFNGSLGTEELSSQNKLFCMLRNIS